jgi:cytochrome-b5 reductase
MSDLPTFTAAEVAAHKTRNDLWIVVHGKGKFDMTAHIFLRRR